MAVLAVIVRTFSEMHRSYKRIVDCIAFACEIADACGQQWWTRFHVPYKFTIEQCECPDNDWSNWITSFENKTQTIRWSLCIFSASGSEARRFGRDPFHSIREFLGHEKLWRAKSEASRPYFSRLVIVWPCFEWFYHLFRLNFTLNWYFRAQPAIARISKFRYHKIYAWASLVREKKVPIYLVKIFVEEGEICARFAAVVG